MKNKILLVWIETKYITEPLTDEINRYSNNREVIFTTDLDYLGDLLERIDIVLGDFPKDRLLSLPNLKWFQQFGTGVEWLVGKSALVDAPFVLTNCSDNHYAVVADQMFALILSMARGIPRLVKAQQQSKWASSGNIDDPSMFQLRGKTMMVVGVGSIGVELIKRGKAFGMNIIGVRRDPTKMVDGLDALYGSDQLNLAASKADIVAACLPNTIETSNLFGQTFFDAMKTTALFFNVGRGSTVDEQALEYSLRENIIAGAGLDVFVTEPLPEESSLWSTPNLLITPHTAGFHREVVQTWIAIAVGNLKRHTNKEPLRNLVDKQLGY